MDKDYLMNSVRDVKILEKSNIQLKEVHDISHCILETPRLWNNKASIIRKFQSDWKTITVTIN